MSAYEKLTIYLSDGNVIVQKWPSKEMQMHIEEAKRMNGFREYRTELA